MKGAVLGTGITGELFIFAFIARTNAGTFMQDSFILAGNAETDFE